MSWVRVADFPASHDLSSLNDWLRQRQYPHRFSIEGDRQVLWTPHAELVEPLEALVRDFEAGVIPTGSSDGRPPKGMELPQIYAPLTLVLLLLSFIGSALYSFGNEFVEHFTFYDRSPFYRSRWAFSAIFEGQYWRLITPVFLHFGFLHIAFNAMWLWYLGARLEQTFGSLTLLVIVLMTGIISNIAQALVSYPIPFGGMSGVVFGLMGFFWVVSKLQPRPELYMPPALFPIMLILMLISMFGTFDWMSGAAVADTAHFSGLMVGLIGGLSHSLIFRNSDEA